MTREEFYAALITAGHVLIIDEDGKVDIFVYDGDTHNGPGCALCYESWCHHCRPMPQPCLGRKP